MRSFFCSWVDSSSYPISHYMFISPLTNAFHVFPCFTYSEVRLSGPGPTPLLFPGLSEATHRGQDPSSSCTPQEVSLASTAAIWKRRNWCGCFCRPGAPHFSMCRNWLGWGNPYPPNGERFKDSKQYWRAWWTRLMHVNAYLVSRTLASNCVWFFLGHSLAGHGKVAMDFPDVWWNGAQSGLIA